MGTTSNQPILKVRVWDGKTHHYPETTKTEANHYLQIGSAGFWMYDAGGELVASSETGEIEWFSGIKDQNDKDIYAGDLIQDIAYDKEAPNGEYYESKLPVFFENGAFWIDESFNKDRSTSTLLAEWEKPLVCGTIHDAKQ